MSINILLAEDRPDHFEDVFDILTITHQYQCFPNKAERKDFVKACRQFLNGNDNGRKYLDNFIKSLKNLNVLVMDINWGKSELLKEGGLRLVNNYFNQTKFPNLCVIFLSVDPQHNNYRDTVGNLYVNKSTLKEPFDKSIIESSLIPAIEYCMKKSTAVNNEENKSGDANNNSHYIG